MLIRNFDIPSKLLPLGKMQIHLLFHSLIRNFAHVFKRVTMSTVIYPSPIFGPVRSRRLGVSLGINLLPADGKVCSFDCVYCECGYNGDHRPHMPLPTVEEVSKALEERLLDMQANGPKPDVLTFAGNGEPTMHPKFLEIVTEVARLRDKYFPEAKLSILSNATRLHVESVRQALLLFDNDIMKLDTVSPQYIELVDRPCGHYDVAEQIAWLRQLHDRVIIQTMFMKGVHEGKDADNCKEEYIQPWLEAVREIAPRKVMVYTIDRETPSPQLLKASREELDAIGERVRALGIECSVSY